MGFTQGLQNNNPLKVNIEAREEFYKDIAQNNKIRPIESGLTNMMTSYADNVSSFVPFAGGTSTPFIGGQEAAYEGRARNQSPGWLIGHATSQFFLGEFVGGTISGTGTLMRPDKWVERIVGTKDAFEKGYVEQIGDWIQEATRDKFPIYQTEKASKGAAFTDASWYASMAPSVASALSIMIPARAASFLPAKIAQLIFKGSKISKAINAIEEGAKILGKISKYSKAEYWATVGSAAIAGRIIDSTRESLNKYDQYYQEFLDKGMNSFDAKKEASAAAAKGFRLSHANIVFDLVEWGTILKMGNYVNKAHLSTIDRLLFKTGKAGSIMTAEQTASASKLFKSELFLDMLKVGLSEGADEMTMDVAQNEGKYNYDVEHNLVPKTKLETRLGEHVTNRKNWDSFIGGAIGGLLFLGGGQIAERLMNRKGIQRQKAFVESVIKNGEANMKIVEQISEAITNKDSKLATTLKDQLLINIASKSYANGTLEYDKTMFDNLAGMSAAKLVEQGLNSDIGSFASDITSNLNEISKIFDGEVDNIRLKDKDGNVHSANFAINMGIATSKAKIALLNKRKEQFEETDEYKTAKKDLDDLNSSITGIGKEYFDTLRKYHENDKSVKEKKEAIKDAIDVLNRTITIHEETLASNTNPLDKLISRNAITTAKGSISNLENTIKEIDKQIPGVEAERKTALLAFDGIDSNGNPQLDPELRTKIDKKLEDIKTNYENNPTAKKYDELTRRLEVEKSILQDRISKEGINFIGENYQQYVEDEAAKQSEQIEEELKGKTLAQVEDLAKKYTLRTDILELTWKPIVTRKIKELTGENKVSIQSKIADKLKRKPNYTETPEVKPGEVKPGEVRSKPKITDADSSIDVLPLVTGLPTVTLSNTPKVDVTKTIAPQNTNISALQLKIQDEAETEINNNKDLKDEVKQSVIHHRINTELFFTDLLGLFLTDANRAIIFENNPELAKLTFLQLYDYLKSTNLENPTTPIERLAFELIELANNLAFDTSIVIDSHGVVERTGSLGDLELPSLITKLNTINPNIYTNVKTTFDKYIDTMDNSYTQLSEILGNVNKDIPFDDIKQRFSETLSANLLFNIEELYAGSDSMLGLLKNSKEKLKDILRQRYSVTGIIAPVTKETILKYLRDTNQLDIYKQMLWVFGTYRSYLENRVSVVKNLISKHPAAVVNGLREIENIGNVLRLFDLGEINDKNVNDETIKTFLERHPTEAPESAPKSGVKAVLNTYNKDGVLMDLRAEGYIEEAEDKSIYKDLHNVIPGTVVVFEQDYDYKHANSLEKNNWETVPVKIKVKTEEDISESTILFLRSLEYLSSGLRYGRKTDRGYEFHGISEVLSDSDYQFMANNFKLLTLFYHDYRQAHFKNHNNADLKIYSDSFVHKFAILNNSAGMQSLFTRIINQNLESDKLVSDFKPEHIANVFDAIFYGVKVEDIQEALYTADMIKGRIESRDRAYELDFASTRSLRQAIDNGSITESKISHVSTPTVLSRQKSNLDPDLRETLDMVVKPTLLKGETVPRIVLVRYDYNSNSYIDLKTGLAITDPKFNASKYKYNKTMLGESKTPIQVLLTASNGELIPYNVQVNTLYRSFPDEKQRDAAITTVVDSILAAIETNNDRDSSMALRALSHIVINDSSVDSSNAYGGTKEFRHLERFASKTESRVTMVTMVNGEQVFVNVVHDFAKGTVSIRRSKMYKDLKRDSKTRFTQDFDFNINVLTKEGKDLLHMKLVEIAGNMLRQTKVGFENNIPKFVHKNAEKNGTITDSTYGEKGITYEDAQDYYIRTGAFYTNAGYVANSNGEIITNFNLRGRFPLTVTIENSLQNVPTSIESSVEGLIGKNKLVSPHDPMVPLLRQLGKAVNSSISKIEVLNTSKGQAIAGTTRESFTTGSRKGTPKNKYRVAIYSAYKAESDKADPYTHVSTNIAHELLHVYINKRYDGSLTETTIERDARIDNILYHNEALTSYINELNAHWSKLTTDEKLELVVNSLKLQSVDMAKNYVNAFDAYLEKITTEAESKNKSAAKAKSGQNINHNDAISEVLTYSYTNPTIALILNGLQSSNVDYSNGRKKSFWNLLIDKFFSILNRLIITAIGNEFTFNTKSELAKLNSLVNTIFDVRLRQAKNRAAERGRKKSEDSFQEDITTQSKIDIKKETLGEINPNTNPENPFGLDDDFTPLDNPDDNEQKSEILYDETYEDYYEKQGGELIFEDNSQYANMITSDEFNNSSIIRSIGNPNEDIKDAENLPIC